MGDADEGPPGAGVRRPIDGGPAGRTGLNSRASVRRACPRTRKNLPRLLWFQTVESSKVLTPSTKMLPRDLCSRVWGISKGLLR